MSMPELANAVRNTDFCGYGARSATRNAYAFAPSYICRWQTAQYKHCAVFEVSVPLLWHNRSIG